MALNRLCLIKDILELGLLELEMLLLESSLFTVCRLGFIRACGACENETLTDIGNVIIIQVLSVVLFYLRSCPATLWRTHIAHESHPLRHILRLINHGVLEALVLQRLVQNVLHVHRSTHSLFSINCARTILALSTHILRNFIKDALDASKFATCQILLLVIA